MSITELDGNLFSSMMDYACENLAKYYLIANRINIFPVPDRDTGTNVYYTINNSLQRIPDDAISLTAYCHFLIGNMEYFALGNSGKIFSLFFKNAFKSLENDNKITISSLEFESALIKGIAKTWEYLESIGFNPKKASILSVIEDSLKGISAPNLNEWVRCHYKQIIDEVWKTKEAADYLAKENVVDSGALTYLYLIEGWNNFLQGKEEHYTGFDELQRELNNTINQIYDVQFIIQGNKEIKKITDLMNCYGDQVIVLENNKFVNCHVHIKDEERVENLINKISSFSKILNISIEDMSNTENLDPTKNILKENKMKKPFIIYTGGADLSRVLPGKYPSIKKIGGKLLCNGKVIEDGERSYKEIREMVDKGILFSTSQPSVQDCKNIMQKVLSEGYDGLILIPLIRRVHCYNQAVKDLGIENVVQYIFTDAEDRQANLFCALALAEDIKKKKSSQEAILKGFKRINNMKIYEIGPTDFFLRTKRISHLENNIGKILGIPIIKTQARQTKLIRGISSEENIEKEFIDLIEKEICNPKGLDILITYGHRDDIALRLKKAFAEKYGKKLRLNMTFMKGGGAAVRGEDSYCSIILAEH
jgi:fatty acid-binding protein DegV